MPNPVDLAFEPVSLQSPVAPGYDARDHRLAWARNPAQEGVVGGTDLKVSQDTGANLDVSVAIGEAFVQGDSIAGQGMYYVRSDSVQADLTHPASDPANPRVDQVVLEVKDNAHDAGGLNVARLRVIAGTPTAGATLDNRTGAAALPATCVRLADVLRPAASGAVTNAQIRDRRPWARGAYRLITHGASYTRSSNGYAMIDATNLWARLELSGAPLEVVFNPAMIFNSLGSSIIGTTYLDLMVDSVVANQQRRATLNNPAATSTGPHEVGLTFAWVDLSPSPGSRGIAPGWTMPSANGTSNIQGSATFLHTLIIREVVRGNAHNG